MKRFVRFTQSVTLPATPLAVYNALMKSREHASFTGGEARISTRVGGKFTTNDGYSEGKNIELKPGRRIVQSWRANEESWPEDHFSTVVFMLAKVKGGTKVQFEHKDVPAALAKALKQGWIDFYWEPLGAYFRKEEVDKK
jgi:uncharacterized protein YndB with AHSA1/START domain